MEYNFSDRVKNLESNAIRAIFKLLSDPNMISFAGGFPSIETLPKEDIVKITNDLLTSSESNTILQYGASEGYLPLRETGINYLKRYGLNDISLDNLIVVSGGQQSIDLTCKAFLNKGDCVLVEDPTYLAVLHILKTYEANVYGIKSNDDGIDLEDLEEKIKKHNPKFIYLVPTFSNPTGKTLSVAKRKAIAEMTAKYGVMVFEDDPYSELRFEGERVPSMKSFDKAGNILFTSSISKTISPGLRVAFVVGSKEVIQKLVLGKQATDVHTSNLSQAIVNEYLKKELLDANLPKMLDYYKTKKDAMIDAIEKYMPKEFKYTNPQGGLFIWGEFDCDIDTNKLFKEVADKKVAYVPGKPFYADGATLNTFRLNFSKATLEEIDRGMKVLGDFMKEKIKELK